MKDAKGFTDPQLAEEYATFLEQFVWQAAAKRRIGTMEHITGDRPKQRKRKYTSDPNGFIVLTQWGRMWTAKWYKTDAGAQKARMEIEKLRADFPHIKMAVKMFPVSALLEWGQAEVNELEVLFKLEPK